MMTRYFNPVPLHFFAGALVGLVSTICLHPTYGRAKPLVFEQWQLTQKILDYLRPTWGMDCV